MTVLVISLTAMVGVLAVLVAGLLRSHATILHRLRELDGSPAFDRAAPFHTRPGIPGPPDDRRPPGPTLLGGGPAGPTLLDGGPAGPTLLDEPTRLHRAPDITGRGLRDDAQVIRTSGAAADTILLFLTSGCATCQAFWTELGDPRNVRLPPGSRLLIVTKGAESESVSAVADLAPAGVELVMSSQAWHDFDVPGSPYVVAVDGPTGRVKGEGTGMSWEQVGRLLAQATGDLSYLPYTAGRVRKPTADSEREARADRELLAAGILPGDSSLYAEPNGLAEPNGRVGPEPYRL